MSSFTDYLENKLLDHSFGGAAFTAPTGVYLALFTVSPTDAGGGSEVTGSGYTRKAITFGAASAGLKSNSSAVTFTATSGPINNVNAVAIFDAASGGNMLAWDAITTASLMTGESLSFPIGEIKITLD